MHWYWIPPFNYLLIEKVLSFASPESTSCHLHWMHPCSSILRDGEKVTVAGKKGEPNLPDWISLGGALWAQFSSGFGL